MSQKTIDACDAFVHKLHKDVRNLKDAKLNSIMGHARFVQDMVCGLMDIIDPTKAASSRARGLFQQQEQLVSTETIKDMVL